MGESAIFKSATKQANVTNRRKDKVATVKYAVRVNRLGLSATQRYAFRVHVGKYTPCQMARADRNPAQASLFEVLVGPRFAPKNQAIVVRRRHSTPRSHRNL